MLQSKWRERQAKYYYKVTPFSLEMVVPGQSRTDFVTKYQAILGSVTKIHISLFKKLFQLNGM